MSSRRFAEAKSPQRSNSRANEEKKKKIIDKTFLIISLCNQSAKENVCVRDFNNRLSHFLYS